METSLERKLVPSPLPPWASPLFFPQKVRVCPSTQGARSQVVPQARTLPGWVWGPPGQCPCWGGCGPCAPEWALSSLPALGAEEAPGC